MHVPPSTAGVVHQQQFNDQNPLWLTLSYIGSTAAQLIAPQLPALHAYLTPDNRSFDTPVRLLSLDLSNNNLGGPRDPTTNLTHGTASTNNNISRRNRSQQLQETALDVLSAHITALTALQSLNLSFNSLSNPAALGVLIASLKPLHWLQELDLSHNLIKCDAAAAAAVSLPSATGLTRLDLSSNYIGCKGAKAITEAMFTSTSLPDAAVCTDDAYAPPAQLQAESSDQVASPTESMHEELSHTSQVAANVGGVGEKSEFMHSTSMVASPLEVLDLSHNNLEPPGALSTFLIAFSFDFFSPIWNPR
jgi:hypothetical protein